MRAKAFAALAMAAAAFWPASLEAQQRERFLGEPGILFTNVTLIDGRGGPARPNSSVLVWDGIIQAVGPTGEILITEGTTVVDLDGLFMIPGLIDVHASVSDSAALVDMMVAGITTIRRPGVSRPAYEAEGREVPKADFYPEILSSGPALEARGQGSLAGLVATSEAETAQAIDGLVDQGVDFIALSPGFPAALAEAAVQAARNRGRVVWGDPRSTDWVAAARVGIDGLSGLLSGDPEMLSVEAREEYVRTLATNPAAAIAVWLDGVDPQGAEVDRMIGALLARDVTVAPLLASSDALRCASRGPHEGSPCESWPDSLRAVAREAWSSAIELLRLLHRDGVRLVIGSVSPEASTPGTGFHHEMELLVAAGIPPRDVVRMATRNAAAALGILHNRGTIEAGKRADMIVLRADPLSDIGNLQQVEFTLVDGRAFGRTSEGRLTRLEFR
jgi:hypothetical protein